MEKIREQQAADTGVTGVKPVVSICTLTFNHAAYLRQAFDSFLAQQTNFPFEIIVHDDASTDSTAEVIAEYQRRYPHIIKPIYQTQNQYSLHKDMVANFVLPQVAGDYIALCEGDDYWIDPYKLQKQFDFLQANPDFSACFTQIAVLRNGELILDEHRHYYQELMGDRLEFGLEDVLQENFIATCSVMFRTQNLENYPKWAGKLPFADWVVHVLNAQKGKIRYLDELMAVYRVHQGGVWTTKSLQERYNGIFLFYDLVSDHLDQKYDEIIMHAIKRIAINYINTSEELTIAKEWLLSQLEHSRDDYALKEQECQKLAGALEHSQRQYVALSGQFSEVLSSPEHKVATTLRRAFNIVAPIGTHRRKFAKVFLRTAYRIAKKCYKKGKTIKLDLSRYWNGLFPKHVQSRKWPQNNPFISVVIPCFNYGPYVEEAVESVLRQTFINSEIIIVDGGSTDKETQAVLHNLNKPRTTVVFREGRHLVGDNRNFGIDLAKGKYICCLDADDMLEQTYFEKALFYLETYGYDVVYPSVQCFGEDATIWHASPTTFERMITVENAVSTVAVFSKAAWQHAGGYKDWPIGEGHVPEDWEFWARLMGLGFKFKNIREPLMLYRVHKKGLTGQCLTSLQDQLKVIYSEYCGLLSAEMSNLRQANNSVVFKVENPSVNLKATKKRQRILLALPFMIIGGADTILLRIFAALHDQYDITVVTTIAAPPEYGDNTKEYQRITDEIYHLRNFLTGEDEIRDFIRYLIESRELDMIFIVGCELIYDMLPEIRKEYPQVVVVDQLFNEFGHIQNNRKHASLIDLTIVANNVIRDVLVNQYRETEDKVKVIIHGIEFVAHSAELAERVAPVAGIVDNKLLISYFARFSNEKAPDLFVEIMEALKKHDVQAVMTGNGPEYQRILDMIAAHGLRDIIYAPGFVDNIRPYLAQTDILLVPSRIEGLPIIILEALGLGVPVIASDLGGISTVVIHGYNGYICEPGNLGQFVQYIQNLIDNPILLREMKINAKNFANENISEDKMNAAYLESITTALQQGKTKGGHHGFKE